MHVPGGSHMVEKATDWVALVAVLSWFNPRLFAWLNDVSSLAALLLPVLGCAWLFVQITIRITKGK